MYGNRSDFLLGIVLLFLIINFIPQFLETNHLLFTIRIVRRFINIVLYMLFSQKKRIGPIITNIKTFHQWDLKLFCSFFL